ncbi:hypothetical protein ACQPW1_28085 [Nocardia sp. CA-128927]|uniref:hypothetical protein n=1 Tax=Nocardia sp. CA-128927 TaxID=3239975 RepID=UPI003D99B6BD
MILAAEFLNGSRQQNNFVVLALTAFAVIDVALIVLAFREWRRTVGHNWRSWW